MRSIIITLLVVCCTSVQAQNYAVFFIPDSLKKGANAVCRTSVKEVNIYSPSRAVVKNKYAITILNPKGDYYGVYHNQYTKLQKLSNISGTLYDALGKKIRNLKQKEILDQSYSDESSLIDDARVKRYAFNHTSYPYTVEFEDEEVLDGIFFLPRWFPAVGENYSVQESELKVILHNDMGVRYKFYNLAEPTFADKGKVKEYTWTVKHIPASMHEDFQPSIENILPAVYLAPQTFSISGYSGSMDTWENFGKFILNLNEGKGNLPANVIADVARLTANVSDRMEKIKILYEYMQQNTRYISVQLGIGSWQPFDATYVATKRYGDCKALSNFMVNLLKEANIPANYVLIKSGEGLTGLWEDFPAPFFNHAVVCVPSDSDTLWLECTSKTVSAGYMGTSTGNRKALMITSDGGKVVQTPLYPASNNKQIRNVKAQVDDKGNLTSNLTTFFSGTQQELQHSLIYQATEQERKNYLNRVLSLPNYSVESVNYKEEKGLIPVITEDMVVKAPNYATITGKRMFIEPNLFNKVGSKLDDSKPRKYPIEYSYAFQDVDTVDIVIPAGYTGESFPKDVSIENKFGKYTITFKLEGSLIRMVRTYEREASIYPASDYREFVEFYNKMYDADRSRIVLVKN